jgi:hypothetical protein
MNGSDVKPVIFRETQKFTQKWIWITIVILVVLCVGVQLYFGVIMPFMHYSWSSMPSSVKQGVVVSGIVALIVLGVGWLMAAVQLVTEVRPDGLYVKFYPFHWSFKRIPLEDVEQFRALTYRPIREYGGWGLRYGKGGKAYNVKGDEGVRLDYRDGKHLLIGSQRAKEFEKALTRIAPDAHS